jgi:ionotropic glutamate receptor NMDA 1
MTGLHNIQLLFKLSLTDYSDPLGAFIWDSTRLEYEASNNCQLRTRGDLFGRSAYGVGLQKNSPWTPHITMAILRMTESVHLI